MKKIIKYCLYASLGAIIALSSFLGYIIFFLPNVGKPIDIKIEINPARVARGKYLANSICLCMDCHSTRDWHKFAIPIIEGTLGKGGEVFDQKAGLPGRFYASNITPFKLKDWTDGEIFSAIVSGVNKEGKALFPIMPYPNYGQMDKEDIYSIIAYLRTLGSIKNDTSLSKADFPMNIIINTMPKPPNFQPIPDKKNSVLYGKYLLTAASCADCHTRAEKGKPVSGMEFAGGNEFPLPTGGAVKASNITPDKETGIGNWTREEFVNRFKAYANLSQPIKEGEFNTAMPWTMYGTMEEEDLAAIYDYLMSLKPVKNPVVKFS